MAAPYHDTEPWWAGQLNSQEIAELLVPGKLGQYVVSTRPLPPTLPIFPSSPPDRLFYYLELLAPYPAWRLCLRLWICHL